MLSVHAAEDPEVESLVERAAASARSVLGPSLRVIWFGSWVRGEAAPRSDIDLALDAGAPIALERFARVRESVESLPTLRTFDLVDLHTASEALREIIRVEGRAL